MSQNIKEKMTIVSYFCGCGGLDLGFIGGFTYNNINFEKLPFEIIAAYDFNEQAIETYKQVALHNKAYHYQSSHIKLALHFDDGFFELHELLA